MRLESLEARHLLAALPLGATSEDTAEFMLGRVAVVPVLFESNGQIDPSTEDWSPLEIQQAIDKVRTGVQWWADTLATLDTVHTLEFVVDDSFARIPFSTPYEPINRTSQESPLYLSSFLAAQGITEAASLEDAVRVFNHSARQRLNTDWAFTVFLIDSSNDLDGAFAPGSEFNIAFAFAGGLYIVSPSTRPASTITHETGHIFWARDEYPGGGSWTDRRGYYNAQNTNAADNPTPGFVQEVSIMRSGTPLATSFNTRYLPASTRAMIGWQDSDGDGIFDVADVPLHLEGEGGYRTAQGRFEFTGSARALTLPNQNSSGPANDITLNRVDRIEYRIDGGDWQTATIVGSQNSDFSFSLVIAPFEELELRAIDARVGVTSPILKAIGSGPVLPGNAIGGTAVVLASGEGEVSPQDPPLAQVVAVLTQADGSPLFRGQVEPDQFPTGAMPETIAGARLRAFGPTLDGRIGSFASPASTGTNAFRYYNLQNARWQNGWATDRQFEATFEQPVSRVEIDAIGIMNRPGYARLEAFDASGNRLSRVTSSGLANGQSETMVIEDHASRIASIRAYGHQFSEVGLDHLRFGLDGNVTSNQSGQFQFTGLADGTYQLELTAPRLIHQHQGPSTVTVVNGVATTFLAPFIRVNSPWMNSLDAFDVDGNGNVEPLDALRIINDLSRNGTRILPAANEITRYLDVTNDGEATPLDALRVINEISRRRRQGASEGENQATDQVLASWNGPADDEEEEKVVEESSLWWEPLE